MKVLMLGWEFPPYISGGLGTACYGLTKGLDRLGIQILFVLPRPVEPTPTSHVRVLSPVTQVASPPAAHATPVSSGTVIPSPPGFSHATFRTVAAAISPYARPAEIIETTQTVQEQNVTAVAPPVVTTAVAAAVPGTATTVIAPAPPPPSPQGVAPIIEPGGHYAGDLFAEIERYAQLVLGIARNEQFDVIHAHDWMTYQAGMAVARLTGKPLVVHVHSTEFDRSGIHVNQRIYDIERAGVHTARRVIAVSHLTRNILIERYGVDARKVEVVYNAIAENDDNDDWAPQRRFTPIAIDEKIVLFLGRVTMQKGPEYFLMAAKRALEVMENIRFVMAGSGDMIRRMIELAAGLGIGHKVLFTGFLRGQDVKRIFQMADLYVMPSVSEPFGITPLEALSHDVPVIISKQSGVAEVLTHALKVDFWDVDEMANKIVAVLRHPPLHVTLREHGGIEVQRFNWTDSAAQCVEVYRKVAAA